MFEKRVGKGLFCAALAAATSFAACSDDGGSEPGSSAGQSGSAGNGGSSGKGGTSSTGGKGGTGPGGGEAGSSGGKGGTQSSGGDGGSISEAGAGGDAGGLGGLAGEGGLTGEGGEGGDIEIPPPVWEWLEKLSPLPEVPPDPTNAFADDPDAAELGQMLFFDPMFSGPLTVASDLGAVGEAGKVSCKTCHASPYLDDDHSNPQTVSIGTGVHTRNSPPLINASFYKWTNWGGRFSAQWELPLAVAENPVTMNGTRLAIAHRIFDVYKTEYEAVFGALEPAIGTDTVRFPLTGKSDADAWVNVAPADRTIVNRILANYSKAIAAYLRLLVSRNTPFDRFMDGETSAISRSAKRGAIVFATNGRCVNCHVGPHFSDDEFHVLGVPPNTPESDDGRFKDVPPLIASLFNRNGIHSDKTDTGGLAGLTNPMPESTRKAFRTPGLRGVTLTAPYMHAGQFATLTSVIEFYDAGGTPGVSKGLAPLHLTATEKLDLIAFLGTLNGEAIPADLLEDTSKP
jgi:cytochrome c peroxidase